MPQLKTKKSKKSKKLKKTGLDILIKKMSSSDLAIKKSANEEIMNLAKNGEDISPVVEKLKGVILGKTEENILMAASALEYYFHNYISYIFYIFPYSRYFGALQDLRSSKLGKRKQAVEYLNTQKRRRPGRGWHYLEDKDIARIKAELGSLEFKVRKKATNFLLEEVQKGLNIGIFILELRNALLDEEEGVRYDAAFALTHFYGKFTTVTYGYYMKHANSLRSLKLEDIISAAEFFAYLTTPDMVSDRDERDIGFVVPLLSILLLNKNRNVRVAALDAIASAAGQGLADALPFIMKILSGDKLEFQERSVFVLRRAVKEGLDISTYIYKLEKLLASDRDPIKFGVADTLTLFYGQNNMWNKVRKLLLHEDKDVRQETAGTLTKIDKRGRDFSPIIPDLIKMLSDDDKEVRFVAARTLMYHVWKNKKTLSLTLPVFKEALRDPEMKMRTNAAYSVKRLVSSKIDITTLIPELVHLLKDEQKNTRENSSDAIMDFLSSLARAKLVMEEIEKVNLKKSVKEVKRVVAKCKKFLKKVKKRKKRK